VICFHYYIKISLNRFALTAVCSLSNIRLSKGTSSLHAPSQAIPFRVGERGMTRDPWKLSYGKIYLKKDVNYRKSLERTFRKSKATGTYQAGRCVRGYWLRGDL